MKNPFENRIFYCNSIKWFIKFRKIENLQQKISSFYQKTRLSFNFFSTNSGSKNAILKLDYNLLTYYATFKLNTTYKSVCRVFK